MKWVLQLGYYRYEGEVKHGWYFSSIPDRQIIPAVASDFEDIQILDNGEYCICACDSCGDSLHKPQTPCSVLKCPFIDGNRCVEQYVPGADYKEGQLIWLNPGTLYQAVNNFTASENEVSAEMNLNADIENGNLRAISGSESSAGEITVHPPVIQSGTWWVYDITTNEYINTGQSAVGKDGSDGFSPEVSVVETDTGAEISVTDK
ncbi:MAG: hypothetical protein NC548_52685, partial [Lachnospiraceae bacterium]|nr:hypothetical protein [Lachnospiraceae bacterium]